MRLEASEAGPAGHPGEGPMVIYVMGAGRSGSTILGVALGNCDGVFYAGELDKWLARSGVPPVQGTERARFWDSVREQVPAQDMFGPGARSLERSSLLLHPRAWLRRRRLRPRYRELGRELFGAIAHTAAADRVVDSSHYPLRARELQKVEGLQLYLLFLVRDPEHVVASLGRDDVPERRYGVLAANAYLWLTYLLASWVFLRQPRRRRMFVRYEEFVADPVGVTGQILAVTGSSGSLRELTLTSGLPFQGNRLIRADTVTLRGPSEAAGPRSRRTRVLQLPWRAVFSMLRPAARAGAPATQPASPPHART
jgi:hypothetical protein